MLISVCIPTRERAEYLKECLATCLAIDDPDIEIVVSDNASTDDTRAAVERTADPRVVYVNTGQRLSMRQNFERCVAEARGDYIIMIGDDDAILPGQFALLRHLLETERPDCLTWRAGSYRWAEGEFMARGGMITIAEKSCFGAPQRRAIPEVVDTVLATDFADGNVVPRIYHGAASRKVIERLRAETGMVFWSSVPDVYFSIAVGAVANDMLFIEHPFSIGGAGNKSTGRAHATSGFQGADNPQARFVRELEADPVVDPIPGKSPTLSFALLNAVEQANRKAYGGRLAIPYGSLYRNCLRELQSKGGDGFESGKALLAALAPALNSAQDLLAMVAAARFNPAAFQQQALSTRWKLRLQMVETAFRQSFASRRKAWILVQRLARGEVALAADVLDWCLGPIRPGEGRSAAETLGKPESWERARKRALALAWRALLRQGVPDGLLQAMKKVP